MSYSSTKQIEQGEESDLQEIQISTISKNDGEKSIIDSKSSNMSSKLDWFQVLAVCLIVFGDTFARAVIIPFLPFLVYDFGLTDDLSKVGYYVCYVEASMAIGQFLSSFVWGYVADKYSRKLVLLVGSFGAALSMILFGLSLNYPWILAMRFFCGLVNGGVDGVGKAHLGSITNKSNQAQAFALLGPAEGLGLIIGPVIGGALARPAVNYPGSFSPDSLFGEHPYLLPCIVSSSVILIISIFASYSIKNSSKKTDLLKRSQDLANDTNQVVGAADGVVGNSQTNMNEQTKTNMTLWQTTKLFMRDRSLMCYLIVYTLMAFCSTVLIESLPLFTINEIEIGGFGWTEKDLGIMLAVIGVSVVPYQVFIYPKLAAKIAPLSFLKISLGFMTPALLLFPCVSFVNYSQALTWGFAILVLALAIWMLVSSNTSMFLLLNNSVDESMLGSVNGIAQTMNAFARTFGPFTGGNLIAWSFNNNLPFPFNRFFLFEILTLIMLSMQVILWYSNRGKNAKREILLENGSKEVENSSNNNNETESLVRSN